MSLIPLPRADLTDADVADALGRAVGLIDLILDVLAEADPLGLRRRTHDLGAGDGIADKGADLLAGLLDFADIPGTQSWEGKDRAARIRWWVRRVGALDTVGVAFPGMFGALADRLPLQDALGFANQALILCAVAREYGVTDQRTRVRLLAAVLCDRELTDPPPVPAPETAWSEMSLVKKLWQLVGILNAVTGELGKRPHPSGLFHYLGMLPGIGAVADYLGEYGAMVRAAEAGQNWIARHTS
ncbi:hypothetical protein ACWDTP_03170 [Mycobacterium sp. NPDC003449]